MILRYVYLKIYCFLALTQQPQYADPMSMTLAQQWVNIGPTYCELLFVD